MRQWKFEVRADRPNGDRVTVVTESRDAAQKAADEFRRDGCLGVKITEN